MNIKELSKKYKDYVINIRRELHACPGLAFEEFEANKVLTRELDKMNLKYKKMAGTGLVIDIKGNKPGKCVLLRADMDCLPIQETRDIEYKSKNQGKMHACGHDGHMAQLLGAIKILNDMRDSIHGTVRCIFQPAEEVGQGADKMIEEGVLDGVDSAFAIHLWADVPVGKISIEEGPRMASADNFKIKILGRGGHGSMPYQCIDPTPVAAAFTQSVQTIVSREIDPNDSVVVTVGLLNSGTGANIIPDYAMLEGTVRCYSPVLRKEVPKKIERILKGITLAYNAKYEMEYFFYPAPVINDSEYTKIAQKSAIDLFGKDCLFHLAKRPTAEDFSAYCNKVKGVLAFVGIRNEEKDCKYPQHHSKFNMDEDALEMGSAIYAKVAIDFLNMLYFSERE